MAALSYETIAEVERGGGKGGYMVALTPGMELQSRVAAQMEREGFAVIRASIG